MSEASNERMATSTTMSVASHASRWLLFSVNGRRTREHAIDSRSLVATVVKSESNTFTFNKKLYSLLTLFSSHFLSPSSLYTVQQQGIKRGKMRNKKVNFLSLDSSRTAASVVVRGMLGFSNGSSKHWPAHLFKTTSGFGWPSTSFPTF